MPKKGLLEKTFYRLFVYILASISFSKFLICLWTSSRGKKKLILKKGGKNRESIDYWTFARRPTPSFVYLSIFTIFFVFLHFLSRWRKCFLPPKTDGKWGEVDFFLFLTIFSVSCCCFFFFAFISQPVALIVGKKSLLLFCSQKGNLSQSL